MKRYRITRVTKTHVWIRDMAFGACQFRPWLRLSRRIPIEDFHRDWERLPQREVRRKTQQLDTQ